MRKILLFLSFGLGILFLIVSTFVVQRETKKLAELRAQIPISVEIIRVVCERKKYAVVFNWKGAEHHKSLPHNFPACEKLKQEASIQIKVSARGKIIFADEVYNGALDGAIYTKVIFGLMIGIVLIYYLVYPHKDD